MTQPNIAKELQEIKQLIINQSSKPMTIDEAADYLKLNKSTMYKMTSAGKISYYKPNGKKIYFLKSQLDNWVQRNPRKAEYEIEEMANKYILYSPWKRNYK